MELEVGLATKPRAFMFVDRLDLKPYHSSVGGLVVEIPSQGE